MTSLNVYCIYCIITFENLEYNTPLMITNNATSNVYVLNKSREIKISNTKFSFIRILY